MRKLLIFGFLVVSFGTVQAQELNASVTVNYDRITNANPQIFKNLETKIRELLNATKWTSEPYTQEERIICNFFVNVQSFKDNEFSAALQVQSSRPIFNSTYTSPVLNINDKSFNFRFLEFEQLIYDQNSFTSNLVAVLAYYAHLIIGIDKDTFSELGGTASLTTAFNIVNLSQSSGYSGWSGNDKDITNRYFVITDLLSNTYEPYRKSLYEFHYKGLDLMSDNLKDGKENTALAVTTLAKIHKTRPNALLTRMFFDAKADEVVSIFTGGTARNNAELIETLNRISPLNSQKWGKIH